MGILAHCGKRVAVWTVPRPRCKAGSSGQNARKLDMIDRETLADWIVHAVGLVCGLVGSVGLLAMAARFPAGAPIVSIGVYVAGLLAMLTCSALYHLLHAHPRRDWLRRLD